MIRRCDLVPQYLAYQKEIQRAMERVLRSGRYVLADEGAAFEEEFSRYMGVKYAAGVGNATDGLILCLKALNVGAGDEVITTPFSAIPTISAIIASGATPRFVDIDPETFLMDLNQIKSRLTARTKAIMPVHIFGNVIDVIRLRQIVGTDMAIVEDAAQAHGSRINGHMAGSMGNCGVFSFYPTKNLGGYGDGGLVASNDKALIDKIKLLRMYGMTDKDTIVVNGVNSRLDELQAAVLRVKLKYLDSMNQKRNKIGQIFRGRLNSDLFDIQRTPSNVVGNIHVFAARCKKNRAALIRHLNQAGIQTNIYYPRALHLQKATAYLGYKKGDFPHAERLCETIIALPMYPELEAEAVEEIIDQCNAFSPRKMRRALVRK